LAASSSKGEKQFSGFTFLVSYFIYTMKVYDHIFMLNNCLAAKEAISLSWCFFQSNKFFPGSRIVKPTLFSILLMPDVLATISA
jgi:hypothetical protein